MVPRGKKDNSYAIFWGGGGGGGGEPRCIMGDVQMVNGMIQDSIMNF